MHRRRSVVPVAALIAVAAIALSGCLQPGVNKAGVTPGYGPGLWRTAGTAPFCNFIRLRSLTGDGSVDTITNDGGESGPRYIQIEASDAAFWSERCGSWWRQDPPGPFARWLATPGQSIPGQGDYLVGPEVAPGVYWSQPDPKYAAPNDADVVCTWKRVRGFHGSSVPAVSHDTILAGGSDHVEVVTIEPGDFGFTTLHCLPWTRVG